MMSPTRIAPPSRITVRRVPRWTMDPGQNARSRCAVQVDTKDSEREWAWKDLGRDLAPWAFAQRDEFVLTPVGSHIHVANLLSLGPRSQRDEVLTRKMLRRIVPFPEIRDGRQVPRRWGRFPPGLRLTDTGLSHWTSFLAPSQARGPLGPPVLSRPAGTCRLPLDHRQAASPNVPA